MNCSGLLRVCHDFEQPRDGVCRANVLGRRTVRLRAGNWMSTFYNVWIAQILLQEQLQIPVDVLEYDGQSTNFYVHDASQSVWGQSAYNWQAVLRAGDDPSCGGNSSRGITSADSECAHAMLEIWSGQAENKRKYSKLTIDGGMLGVVGRIGWYATEALLDRQPALASHRGFRDGNATRVLRRPLRLREHCATAAGATSTLCVFSANCTAAAPPEGSWAAEVDAACGAYHVETLGDEARAELDALGASLGLPPLGTPVYPGAFADETDGDGAPIVGAFASVACDWTNYDQTVIDGDGLALRRREYTSGEMRQIAAAAVANDEPVMHYWWAPDPLLARGTHRSFGEEWALSRVALRSHTEACETARPKVSERCDDPAEWGGAEGGCDYRVEILTKVFARSLPEWNPLAHELLDRLYLTTEDQLSILAAGAYDATPRDAVCEWVRDNEATWREWLPTLQAVCPVAGGLPCGGAAVGECVFVEHPYPEGRCECAPMYTGEACGTCAEGYVRAPVGLDGGTSPCVKCDGGCNGRGACAAASAGSAAAAVGDGVCVCEGPFGGSRCEIYDTTFKCGRGERPVLGRCFPCFESSFGFDGRVCIDCGGTLADRVACYGDRAVARAGWWLAEEALNASCASAGGCDMTAALVQCVEGRCLEGNASDVSFDPNRCKWPSFGPACRECPPDSDALGPDCILCEDGRTIYIGYALVYLGCLLLLLAFLTTGSSLPLFALKLIELAQARALVLTAP